MALIEFRGVRKAFGPKVVYRHLDLDVQEGEALTIVGGSGQGKSVLLKLLIGLLRVDGGTIRYDGEIVSELAEEQYGPVRQQVAMLFQGAALFDSLSVRDNITYGLREHQTLPESEMDARVEEALEYVGLPGTQDMWPADLSVGMQKRVGLARAIAMKPRVLLYDEPTTGLDPINVARIDDLILHLQRSLDVTSIVVTHDMHSAFLVSDRMAMIQDGRVVFSGTPAEFRQTPEPIVRDFIDGNAPEDEDTETLLRSVG
ncbi:MAG: ATP-binding cassette domain-containing protein [Myxococcales bacterium]|nr:ATP-binding cassette domain-containing protein [Myxococcales bacterium]